MPLLWGMNFTLLFLHGFSFHFRSTVTDGSKPAPDYQNLAMDTIMHPGVICGQEVSNSNESTSVY